MSMKLFYLHVPKTAGSSINQLLAQQLSPCRCHIESAGKLTRVQCNEYDFLSGHVTFSRMSGLLNLSEWTKLVTLRDPASCVVSHLNWVRKLAEPGQSAFLKLHSNVFQAVALKMKAFDFSKPADITRFIGWLREIEFLYFHNTQTRYLLHGSQKELISDSMVETAISHLHEFEFIGILEYIDELYEQLGYEFSWKIKGTRKVNVNKNNYGFDLNDPLTVSALEPLFEKDAMLYDAAFLKYQKQKLLYSRSPVRHIEGQIVKISDSEVRGWALSLDSRQKLELELRIDNSVVQTCVAKKYCHDVKLKQIHPTGCCGFSFDVRNLSDIRNARVFIRGTQKEICRSE